MRQPLSWFQTHTPRDPILSIMALLTRLIIFVGVGFAAGFLFRFFLFAGWEPLVYPCPYADHESICIDDANKPEPQQPVLLF